MPHPSDVSSPVLDRSMDSQSAAGHKFIPLRQIVSSPTYTRHGAATARRIATLVADARSRYMYPRFCSPDRQSHRYSLDGSRSRR
jgi:hypothetical protein